MRGGPVLAFTERVSTFLAEHPLRSLLITGGVILLMADAIRRVLTGQSEVNVLTWIVFGLMAWALIGTVLMPKLVAPNLRILVAWSVAVSPALYGFAAALADSPVVVMWFGVLLSLCLVTWVAIVEAPRATKSLPDDES